MPSAILFRPAVAVPAEAGFQKEGSGWPLKSLTGDGDIGVDKRYSMLYKQFY